MIRAVAIVLLLVTGGGSVWFGKRAIDANFVRVSVEAGKRKIRVAQQYRKVYTFAIADLKAALFDAVQDPDWWYLLNEVWAEKAMMPIDLVRRVSAEATEKDVTYAIYSNEPWNARVKDLVGFRRRAVDFAHAADKSNPGEALFYHELEEGRIRIAGPDIMHQVCVNCHNEHPKSPKKDWLSGQVGGVVEAELPVLDAQEFLNPDTIAALMCLLTFGLIGGAALGRSSAPKSGRMSSERLRSIFDDDEGAIYEEFFRNCPLGAILIEADGTIKDANGKLATMLGYSVDDLRNMHINNLLPKQYRGNHMNLVSGFLEKHKVGMTAAREVEAQHRDGHVIRISLAIGILASYDVAGDRTVVGAGLTSELG